MAGTGEHHSAGCPVDRTGHRLRDVVFNDTVASENAPQDAEAQDGGQF